MLPVAQLLLGFAPVFCNKMTGDLLAIREAFKIKINKNLEITLNKHIPPSKNVVPLEGFPY
jgi:hypothetical protein